MKLLLRKDIDSLGLCGDVVEVKTGYARNYLLPQHLALEPTKSNLKAIEEDKKIAAAERARKRQILEDTCKRLEGVEVNISAACTPEGHLYGSVGPREISSALLSEGHSVHADQIKMTQNIKEVGTFQVPIVFADDIRTEAKVWVVREKTLGDEEEEAMAGETEVTDDADEATAGNAESAAESAEPAGDI